MRRALLAAAAAATASGALADDAGLVTVLTSAEPQTQLMAMAMTMQAVQTGLPTRVLLCGPAGDIGLPTPPESATAPQPPRGMSPRGLMQAVMKAGAAVEVCAIYLPGKGLAPDALLNGVGVAQPPGMARAMLDATNVWTF